ncbi:MAG: class I SAM-dependent methyltransferase [Acidimicrobiales bacterium]
MAPAIFAADSSFVTDNAAAWDHYSAEYQAAAHLPSDTVQYGPDLPNETDLHLLGDVKGKRVIELGCGGGQACIAFARQGASVTGVDFSAAQLAHARRLCDLETVKVELRQSDLADLAFLRSDSVDLVFSAGALGYVEDLPRVFRQVHRVLKVGAPLVFSMPHPASALIDADADDALLIRRAYSDDTPLAEPRGEISLSVYPHTFADIFMGLMRTSYRVETILEPEAVTSGPRSAFWRDAFRLVPRTIIIKARKAGN